MSTLEYMKHLFTDRYIASITPTSEWGVKKICSKIDFSHCQVVVEYGPGTGVISQHLLKNMGPNGHLLLVERNMDFAKILKKRFPDPRVTIINDCASRVLDALAQLGKVKADYVISGIPFSFLTNSLKDTIIKNTFTALKPGGKFLAYQTFYQANNHLKDHLEQCFPAVIIEYEMLNLPPLRIYEALKSNGHASSAAF